MIQAVAFDLDDTLAVTSRDRETLLSDATARAGVDEGIDRESYLEAHREHSGAESRRPVFEALVDERAAASDLTRAYREAVSDAMEPVDGAEGVLAALGGQYSLGLLTDGPERTQRDKLDRLGWTDAFDVVVVTGGIDAPKPEPGSFVALADALDVPPSAIVYVGDNPDRDVAGAATAGMTPVQVVYDGGPAAHPLAARTVPRSELASLPGVIEGLADGSDDP
ncbi:HAD family hydrolase [Halobacteriales archaeon QH_10_70_21]|nr:MAG: HAD family hydrolase [Halobacteriales archaeon QH_10_70_21]